MTATSVSRVYNFSAGPATLPLPVLQQIQDEIISLPGVGASVLEISHRSKDFDVILEDAQTRIADLLGMPETHEVLFLQGGSALQNAMMPMNFLTDKSQTADYIVSGAWGKKSAAEVHRFGNLNVAWDGKDSGYNCAPQQQDLQLTPGAAYCHMTSNETIQGVQFSELPDAGSPLVVDKSSDMFAEPIDVAKYGMIYACAQKNCGVAGVTVIVMEKSLLERCNDRLPSYLDYSKHSKGGSRFNTPPTFAIYVTGLVCKWLQNEMGGLTGIAKHNEEKAKLLYDVIDQSNGFYAGHAEKDSRSTMNVVFKMADSATDDRFLEEATQNGMTTLKGHRSLGGIRASIYNAMPLEGVEALSNFMKDFASKNG
ncbi:MAG: 3-phosphoserine/phosphohydroxythreonine transaminase [Mariniblastus sp.]|nr:3-phosphoserine/phosphohydroxythreonine transaminase [Mariniblastus sp.]